MKPAKKAKGPRISPARREATRRMLNLWDQAERAERALYDAEAVAKAVERFQTQSYRALATTNGVSALERAEAVYDAAVTFGLQAEDAVATAQLELEKARGALFTYNDKRIKQSEADEGLHKKVLSRVRERPHTVAVDIDDLSEEASATGKKK